MFEILTISTFLILIISIAITQSIRNHFKPQGKHCYIGGGSQGLGLSLACLLAQKGAHVTIVARHQKKLDKALALIETQRQSPTQKFQALSFDLTSSVQADSALELAARPFGGKVPEVVFACAGGAAGYLDFFIKLSPEALKSSVDINYWTAVWTAQSAARRMAKEGIHGRIILTSSVIGFFGLPGYSAYAPLKHALRGLTECLRSELQLYKIRVHCYFPATIFSPGFEAEQKSKPELTKILEGPDEGLLPDECAKRLIKGLEAGHCFITSDPIGHLFRTSMRGAAPISNYILDPIFATVATIALPIWRKMTDRQVKQYTATHQKEVVDQL
ncbi:hypothetical protein CROQUDRAFT_712677 [Cronartium quercuum f. sp. fusiforme G11]|uniref:3-dehydrosphinganine reductase n=1 Tax=Cronartium quercuum f. sp. fusiforme G11 TaxID=708437 RepID=A0A9P6TIE3_9BASI|nr:hypothetical protein CROQUDRAFT_712677 [Cronartium quercuum f. sp. fusiforme G11]